MFPKVGIVRWRGVAPWADDDDVEQDLVITLALFDIFRDPLLKDALAFRGGTALHKLHLGPAARYSEDIDLVQRDAGPIGPARSRLRRVLEWIGASEHLEEPLGDDVLVLGHMAPLSVASQRPANRESWTSANGSTCSAPRSCSQEASASESSRGVAM